MRTLTSTRRFSPRPAAFSFEQPMGGQPKSKASSWSSAEVGRLWEEPTEAISGEQTERPWESSRLRRRGCQSGKCREIGSATVSPPLFLSGRDADLAGQVPCL